MMLTESVIQAVLLRYTLDEKHHVLAVPNSTVLFNWEADLVSVTKAGLVHEYEVKLSLADYRRDFGKKWKHASLQDQMWRSPNYFWYVTSGFEIEPPEYAGWLEIVDTRSGRGLIVHNHKEAPRLHSKKVTEKQTETIGHLLAYRLKNLYHSVYENKWYGNRSEGHG